MQPCHPERNLVILNAVKNLVTHSTRTRLIGVLLTLLAALVIAGGSVAHAKEGPTEDAARPQAAPVAPWISIERITGTNNIELSWEHAFENDGYQVWRGTAPYFDPGLGQGNQILYQPKGPGGTLTFTDTGVDWFYSAPADPQLPAVQVLGNPAVNYFWVVRGQSGPDVSANSNRVGEFDFGLTPGS